MDINKTIMYGCPIWERNYVDLSTTSLEAAKQKLAKAGMLRKPKICPLVAQVPGKGNIPVNGMHALCSEVNGEVIPHGIVKGRVRGCPASTEEVLLMYRDLVQNGVARYKAAGELLEGAVSWTLVELVGMDSLVTKDDIVRPYLLTINDYDGNTSLKTYLYPFRTISNVGLSLIQIGNRVLSRTPKTETPKVLLPKKEYDSFISVCRAMAKTKVDSGAFFSEVVLGGTTTRGRESKRLRNMREVAKEQLDAPWNITRAVSGTVWAMYCAACEYAEWRQVCPKQHLDSTRRMYYVWQGGGGQLKDRALGAARRLVGL